MVQWITENATWLGIVVAVMAAVPAYIGLVHKRKGGGQDATITDSDGSTVEQTSRGGQQKAQVKGSDNSGIVQR